MSVRSPTWFGIGLCLWLPTSLFLQAGGSASAAEPMAYIYNAPESALDVRYRYHWEILDAALRKTEREFGPYAMIRAEFMTERRQAHELRAATGKLTVMYLGTTQDFERDLIGVHIPVDRNLGGYCVFLIRKERMDEFARVRGLDDLRRFSFGLGLGWEDVDILRHNGLKVVTGSSYDGLFEMLVHRRFDVFLRAAVEVLDEYAQRREAMPDLAIEPSLILYYPLPMYFWFPRTEQGRRLAARAEAGMRLMLEDGTYQRIFDQYQSRKIAQLRLKERRIIRIENHLLGSETPFADKRLWFDPQDQP